MKSHAPLIRKSRGPIAASDPSWLRRSALALGFAAVALLPARAPAQVLDHRSYQLVKIEQEVLRIYDTQPTMLAQGITKIRDFHADSAGGSFSVDTVRPYGNEPRSFSFKWKFNRDVTSVPAKESVKVTFEIGGPKFEDENFSPNMSMAGIGRATDGTVVIGYLNRYFHWGKAPADNERARTLYETAFSMPQYPDGGFNIIISPDGSAGTLTVKYIFEGKPTPAAPPPVTPTTGSAGSGTTIGSNSGGSPGTGTGNSGAGSAGAANSGVGTGGIGMNGSGTGAVPPPPALGPSSVTPRVNLNGNWVHVENGAATRIIQNGTEFTVINEWGVVYHPKWTTPDAFVMDLEPLTGTASADANLITWSNGSTWRRAGLDGQPLVTKMTLKADTWKVKQGETVTVPVRLLKGEGLIDMNFNVNYDASVAQAQSPVGKGNLLEGGDFEGNPGSAGVVKVGFVPKSGGIAANSGTVALLTFKAVGRAGSKTALTLVPDKSTMTGGGPADLETIHGLIVIVDDTGFPPGDIDGDGTVEMNEVLLALKMSVGLIPVNLRADVDKDGQVKATDARLIRERVLGGGQAISSNR